ncbi:MAG: glycosyltransferase [Methanobacterium sp. Maddingley MBC34]|nr:MAG: glycosyltransferase [Methanobacterium sp. Maddingley MBC34]
MKLFVLAPEITENHTALAFLPTWIRKIADNVDELTIFTLNYDENTWFPENVSVYCPPRGNRFRFFFYIHYYIFKNVWWSDEVFSLMYPILTIWASRFTRLFNKPLVMWYAHGAVSDRMKKAHKLCTMAVTSSAAGFRLKSDKLRIIGQAIDTNKFIPGEVKSDKIKIMYLGRISKVKGIGHMIRAADILVNKEKVSKLEFEIVGDITSETEREYLESLKNLTIKLNLENYINFTGKVPFTNIENVYQSCNIFVNPSNTGSLDKTVLEAMSCGKIVITCNEAYYKIFPDDVKEHCYFVPEDYEELAEKIKMNILTPNKDLELRLREIVVKDHSLDRWVKNLMDVFKEIYRK